MQKQTLRQRFKNVFAPNGEATVSAKALNQLIEDQRRSQIYNQTSPYQILDLPYDYNTLYDLSTKNSEVLRVVHEAIIKECTRNRGSVKPRWRRKCPSCGTTFQTDVVRCPECKHGNGVKVETVKPNIEQKRKLEAFIEDPNNSDEILAIQVSCYRYMLACSDWYISVQKANPSSLSPLMIYVEDATKMRVCVDLHDNLGNGEYFCPQCTATYPQEHYMADGRCIHCGNTELKETAYIYLDGTTKARWAKDEMLHGTLDPDLPRRYGLSRVITALRIIYSVAAMNQFNLDTYTEGKLAKILGFIGMDQSKVNDLMQAAKAQQNKPQYDANTGRWTTPKLHTLGLGIEKDIKSIDSMPDPEKMQSLEWWALWKETICSIYGVKEAVSGTSPAGSTGQNPRMQLDINNNTTEAYQHAWSDPFNNVIVSQALNVTDWVYEFNPVEEKDEAQDIAILQAKLTAIQTAVNLGLTAELTDEQEVKISGQPETLVEKQKRAMQTMQKQTEAAPGDATPSQKDSAFESKQPFKKENVFANEKAKRWLVIENPNKETA